MNKEQRTESKEQRTVSSEQWIADRENTRFFPIFLIVPKHSFDCFFVHYQLSLNIQKSGI